MRRVVIRTGLVLSLLLGVGGLVVSQELPPDVRADQYLMEGKRAVDRQDLPAAVEAFKKVEALPVDPPVDFAFWYGRVLVEHGIAQTDVAMVNKGEGFLKEFILATGRESDHYATALEWISRAEGEGLPRPPPATDNTETTAQAVGPKEPEAQDVKLDRCDSNDNNLWGRWECGGGDLILSHAFDSDGIEHVTFEKEKPIWGWDTNTYPVDEKWHSNTQTGKRDNVSCNGWNDRGFRVMSILTKENPGDHSAKYVDYYVNHRDVLWIKYGDIRKDQNGKITSEENYKGFCRRY